MLCCRAAAKMSWRQQRNRQWRGTKWSVLLTCESDASQDWILGFLGFLLMNASATTNPQWWYSVSNMLLIVVSELKDVSGLKRAMRQHHVCNCIFQSFACHHMGAVTHIGMHTSRSIACVLGELQQVGCKLWSTVHWLWTTALGCSYNPTIGCATQPLGHASSCAQHLHEHSADLGTLSPAWLLACQMRASGDLLRSILTSINFCLLLVSCITVWQLDHCMVNRVCVDWSDLVAST